MSKIEFEQGKVDLVAKFQSITFMARNNKDGINQRQWAMTI
jgi:hypothetical protein